MTNHVDITGEIGRCAVDPGYFMTKYLKVRYPEYRDTLSWFQDGRLESRDEQLFIMKALKNVNKCIVPHPRRVGMTTMLAAYALWYATFHVNRTICISTPRMQSGIEFIRLVDGMRRQLPDWLQPGIEEQTLQHLTLRNACRILVVDSSPERLRGYAISLLIWMDASLVSNQAQLDFWNTASHVSLTPYAGVIVASTPSYRDGDLFEQMIYDADAGLSGFTLVPYGPRSVEDLADTGPTSFEAPAPAPAKTPMFLTRDQCNLGLYNVLILKG